MSLSMRLCNENRPSNAYEQIICKGFPCNRRNLRFIRPTNVPFPMTEILLLSSAIYIKFDKVWKGECRPYGMCDILLWERESSLKLEPMWKDISSIEISLKFPMKLCKSVCMSIVFTLAEVQLKLDAMHVQLSGHTPM